MNKKSIPTQDHIRRAVELLDGPVSTARRLGVRSHQVVQQWVRSGRVPPKYCAAVERETGGQVRSEQICPDVDWCFYRRTAE